MNRYLSIVVGIFVAFAQGPAELDLVIRGGTVYDGTGGAPVRADVGIDGDRIAAVGDLSRVRARRVVDARGLAVAPGFVNMLSWADVSLVLDGRSMSDIKQGVTTEIFGEGQSMGPLDDGMKRRIVEEVDDPSFSVEWTTLAEYLTFLERRGVSCNVASFVGATTVREHVVGLEERPATAEELARMRDLVRREMADGALGVGSALTYAPGTYATTEEIVELCKVAAEYGGVYISHVRDESDRLVEAVDELLRIAREARIPAEIYHLKASREANWTKLDRVLEMIEAARRDGHRITANVYLYTATSNGLTTRVPAWAHAGGATALRERLSDPATRARIVAEMRERELPMPRVLLVGLRSDALKPLAGKTLAEVAAARGKDEVETIVDLVLEDRSPVQVVSFTMSEENLEKTLRRPWVSIGSDAESIAAEGKYLESSTHPRSYGNVARLLGRYVRERKVISLSEAVRRLSGLPATNLGLDRRGFLKQGFFADVVVFDPATVEDRATYERPHQYAAGMRHVIVNGVHVLADGEHTGARPGRALRGPGTRRSAS